MRVVGIRTLKNSLSEYIRLVQSGETILVTDRDRVVAEIIAPREGRATTGDDAALAELVRKGSITPPLLRDHGPPPSIPVQSLKQVLADLSRDRSDRS